MGQYNDEIQLRDILIKFSDYKSYLFKKKSIIITLSVIFFVLGFIFSLANDKKYTANLTFVVEDQQNGNPLGAMSGMASQFGFNIEGNSNATFSQNNIFEFLQSRGVVEAALMQSRKINEKDDLLIEHYIHINKINEAWQEYDLTVSFHGNSSRQSDSVSGVIWNSIINDELLVKLHSDEANIINLSYTSVNEEFAKIFVETLIEQMS